MQSYQVNTFFSNFRLIVEVDLLFLLAITGIFSSLIVTAVANNTRPIAFKELDKVAFWLTSIKEKPLKLFSILTIIQGTKTTKLAVLSTDI